MRTASKLDVIDLLNPPVDLPHKIIKLQGTLPGFDQVIGQYGVAMLRELVMLQGRIGALAARARRSKARDTRK